MSFIDWANSKTSGLKWLDIKLAQIASLCVGLLLGAYLSEPVLAYWWIFLTIAVIAGVIIAYKIFLK